MKISARLWPNDDNDKSSIVFLLCNFTVGSSCIFSFGFLRQKTWQLTKIKQNLTVISSDMSCLECNFIYDHQASLCPSFSKRSLSTDLVGCVTLFCFKGKRNIQKHDYFIKTSQDKKNSLQIAQIKEQINAMMHLINKNFKVIMINTIFAETC